MRVLLTGSSGWLGCFLAPKLRTAGHSVIGLDVVAGEFTDMVGSVADRAVVERVFADHAIEKVIHAGALHKPDIARFPPQAFVDVNVTGTLPPKPSACSAFAPGPIFAAALAALRSGAPLPFAHDPDYVSPSTRL
jgi:UDP-glucose 4-epimerase